MFSGGVGSYITARRVREKFWQPNDRLTLLFSDVGGDRSNPHAAEDEDCYRFIDEASAKIADSELVVVRDGRNIWQVFMDDRFLGNSRLANCSKFLKQRPARQWLEKNADPAHTVIYVGIDWTESHRIPAIEQAYLPWVVVVPLADPPYLYKDDMLAICRDDGIKPPRMYDHGYPHANCGGGCVRAGQGQFKMLLEQNPERFLFWEQQEQKIREYLGKDVAILRDRRGGRSKPLPLSVFRQRLSSVPDQIDADDIGGCGCFVD